MKIEENADVGLSTVEVLKKAKQLLIDKGWTQRMYARDEHGDYTDEQDPQAACYCGHGAVFAAMGCFAPWKRAVQVLDIAAGCSFPKFNDAKGRTLEEVLAVFDKAIADLEGPADAPQQ